MAQYSYDAGKANEAWNAEPHYCLHVCLANYPERKRISQTGHSFPERKTAAGLYPAAAKFLHVFPFRGYRQKHSDSIDSCIKLAFKSLYCVVYANYIGLAQ